jgi:hypothetical protein
MKLNLPSISSKGNNNNKQNKRKSSNNKLKKERKSKVSFTRLITKYQPHNYINIWKLIIYNILTYWNHKELLQTFRA